MVYRALEKLPDSKIVVLHNFDLSSFGFWWNNNAIIAQDTCFNSDTFQKAINMLLAIWATDKKQLRSIEIYSSKLQIRH